MAVAEPRPSGAPKRRVRIFQIFYSPDTERQLDPAFTPLDNTANERPDWAELWPIHQALDRGGLGDDELLGFFSPRFRSKTGLSGQEVLASIEATEADVYSFSPYFEQGVLYANPFLQGEAHHPGLATAAQQLLPRLGMQGDVRSLVCDQSTTVFGNYFVAPGSLWAAWHALAMEVFDICERGRLPVARRLTAPTAHREGAYQMKVFVVERLITLLLEHAGRSAAWLVDPRRAPRSIEGVDLVLDALVVLESLKREYRRLGDRGLLRQYRLGSQMVRETLVELSGHVPATPPADRTRPPGPPAAGSAGRRRAGRGGAHLAQGA
jgi:hypothetical protein